MPKVILIRHGDYNGTGSLSSHGREAVEECAAKLAPHVQGKVKVCTSSLCRSVESAEIIARVFNAEVCVTHVLTEDDVDIRYADLHNLIQSELESCSVLFCVGHLAQVSDFAPMYLEREHGMRQPFRDLGKGAAVILDLDAKTLEYIRP